MTNQPSDNIKISPELMDNIDEMRNLTLDVLKDLSLTVLGNKTAAQRIRKNTIIFDKCAREFRKISIKELHKGLVRDGKKSEVDAFD